MLNVRVLVVEDESWRARDIVARLNVLGFKATDTASSGEEAIRKACQNPPDVVLMDTQLKGAMDSIRTAEQIRGSFDVPVVYLAGSVDDETLQKANVTEPFEYVLKPLLVRELRKAIEMTIFNHRMRIPKKRS